VKTGVAFLTFTFCLFTFALLHGSGKERAAAVGGDGVVVFGATDHAVEVDVAAGEDEEYVAGAQVRVFDAEADDGGDAVLLFERLELESVGIDDDRLRGIGVVCRISHLSSLTFAAPFRVRGDFI
jgi:hypothetical protein